MLSSASDADWAGDPASRKSTTGQAHFLNGLLVHWNSKLQVPIAMSSTESETVALSATGRAARGIENLLNEVTKTPLSVELTGDNRASLFLATGSASLRKVRHLDLSDLYCRMLCERHGWDLRPVGTIENVADMGTKILDSPTLKRLSEKCCLIDRK